MKNNEKKKKNLLNSAKLVKIRNFIELLDF